MKLSPINTPPIAQVSGAKTLSASDARAAAMAAFNAQAPDIQTETPQMQAQAPFTTGQSPAQPGAVIDPANALGASTDAVGGVDTTTLTPTPEAAPALSDQEAKIKAHYANLARKEKLARMREARIDQKLAQLEARVSGDVAQTPPPSSFDPSKFVSREELENDPFGVLNTLGLGYDKLTEKALQAPSAEEMAQRKHIKALEAKLAAIEKAQEDVKKTFEQGQLSARAQAEQQILRDVTHLVAHDEAYAAIHASGHARNVVKLITDIYDQGAGDAYPKGTLLDIHEAAALVEEELIARNLKLASLPKIKSRIAPDATAQKPTQTQQQTTPTLRTLTNNVGTSTRKQSPRERALAAFRGEVV